ncbi:MAG: hypothetical protein H8E38_10610 [SAR324 cluster bacterium]|nr:hypothetical protein [SAR324 cluster bacterium]
MEFLPIFINLRKGLCLVTGGGQQALQKIQLLKKAGAVIHLAAPNGLCAELQELLNQQQLQLISGQPIDLDVSTYNLIIAASEDQQANKLIAEKAQENNIPVNVVDRPELCSFLLPSIVDRSPLIVAVSSCGKSPTLSRFIRKKIAAFLPASFGELAVMLGEFREKNKPYLQSYAAKKEFWKEMIFSGPLVELFVSGKKDAARKILEDELELLRKT